MFDSYLFGAFGLILGSFLNVLILRWEVRPLTGRSSCVTCGRTILWYDLVPVLSWMMLGGRCRSCGARISLQYLLVEVGTGFLFVVIGLAPLPLSARLLALPITASLLAIAVYDFRHSLIPDAWVYVFAGLSLIASLISVTSGESQQGVFMVLLAGPVVALPLFAFWFFSNGAWMGFGDVKLALGMGWLLGFSGGFLALFLAFILGGLIGVPLLFFSSHLWGKLERVFTPSRSSQRSRLGFTMKSEIPFGPFLIAATLIVWITHMHGYEPILLVL